MAEKNPLDGLFITYLRVPDDHPTPIKKPDVTKATGFTVTWDMRQHPVGVIVAVGPNIIGWSLCGPKDHFSYKRAREIAIGRMHKPSKRLPPPMMAKFITATLPKIVEWARKRELPF